MTGAIDYTEEIAGVLSLQLYDARTCDAILEYARATEAWTKAIVSVRKDDGRFDSAVTETRLASALTPTSESEVIRDFDEKLDRMVKPLVNQYWHVNLQRHCGTHLVRYAPGDYYEAHTDTGVNLLDRYFTVLCYLNDDFEGGRTIFPELAYSVVPQRGRAVVFPATYVHRAERVGRGDKYVLVSWLMGPLPVMWI